MQFIEISIHSNHPLVPQLPCKEQRLRFSLTQQSIQEIQLVLTGDIHTWVQIQDQKLFAYQKNICGPIFGGEFQAFKDYIITAGLRSQDVTMLSVLWEREDLETFVKKQGVHRILTNPSSYRLYSVMQQFNAKTQWGMTTTYFNEA